MLVEGSHAGCAGEPSPRHQISPAAGTRVTPTTSSTTPSSNRAVAALISPGACTGAVAAATGWVSLAHVDATSAAAAPHSRTLTAKIPAAATFDLYIRTEPNAVAIGAASAVVVTACAKPIG